MSNMHLVTGCAGKPHVTSADQASLHAAVLGSGNYILARGTRFAATVVNSNTVRIGSGDILMQGRHIRIDDGSTVDVAIQNGTSGYKRNDLIVVRYTRDVSTGVESADLVVIKGTATTGTASDPAITEGDIITGNAKTADMPLYRIPLNGLTIGTPVKLAEVHENFNDKIAAALLSATAYSSGQAVLSAANTNGGVVQWCRCGRTVQVNINDLGLNVSTINRSKWTAYTVATGLPAPALGQTAYEHLFIEAAQSNCGRFRVNADGSLIYYHHENDLIRGAKENTAAAFGVITYISAD